MGWSFVIGSDQDITEETVQEIVDTLPERFQCKLPGLEVRQLWGWSTACDIGLPNDNMIGISGSFSVSSGIAEAFVEHFINELNKRGHSAEITEDGFHE